MSFGVCFLIFIEKEVHLKIISSTYIACSKEHLDAELTYITQLYKEVKGYPQHALLKLYKGENELLVFFQKTSKWK